MSALGGAGVIDLSSTFFSTQAVVVAVTNTINNQDISAEVLIGNIRTFSAISLSAGDYAFGVLDFARVGNEIIFYVPTTSGNWNLGITNPRLVNIPAAVSAAVTAPDITIPFIGITTATIEFTGLLRGSAVQGGDYTVGISLIPTPPTPVDPINGDYLMIYTLDATDFTENKFSFDVYDLEAGEYYAIAVIVLIQRCIQLKIIWYLEQTAYIRL